MRLGNQVIVGKRDMGVAFEVYPFEALRKKNRGWLPMENSEVRKFFQFAEEVRKQHGWTHEEMTKILDVHYSTYHRWRTGRAKISIERLNGLWDRLQKRLDQEQTKPQVQQAPQTLTPSELTYIVGKDGSVLDIKTFVGDDVTLEAALQRLIDLRQNVLDEMDSVKARYDRLREFDQELEGTISSMRKIREFLRGR